MPSIEFSVLKERWKRAHVFFRCSTRKIFWMWWMHIFLKVSEYHTLLPTKKKHLWSCFQLGESLIQHRSPRCESLKTFRVHWFHMFRSMWFCCNLPWVPARWWCATFPGHRWWKKRHGFYTMPDVVWNVQKLLWKNSTMILLDELIWTRSSYFNITSIICI